MFDGNEWYNYGTWRPGEFTLSADVDNQGNVWVCGLEGAAKRDVNTGDCSVTESPIAHRLIILWKISL
jgi:hypothetical protein